MKLFEDNHISSDFSDMGQLEEKIVGIIKDIKCKYKINYID